MTDQFTFGVPSEIKETYPSLYEWCRQATFLLDDLTREDGVVSTVASTEETVLTQGEKLDLITVTQTVDLDSMESTLGTVASGSPTYNVTNERTERTLDADAAAGAITDPPTQAEIENIRDAVLNAHDFLGTLVNDLTDKGVLG